MKGFTWVDMVVLVVYLGAVLLAGLAFSKKEMKGKEFFKGDGTIPWWVTSVSIFATLLSPISFLSLAGNSYGGSWILWFAQLGMLIAIPLTIRFFLPLYSRLKIDTAYEYLEVRYKNKGLRILGAVMFIVYQIGRMSIIMYLPSMVLAQLTGINVNLLIIVMGVIAIIYSYTGGLKSVLWTDFIQGMVLIVGVTFALGFLLFNIDGGIGAVLGELAGGKFLAPTDVVFDINILKSSAFIILVGAGFNTFSSYISSQDIVQRFTTTTDIKQLKKMTYGNGVLSIFLATVFYLIGTALFVFYNQNPALLQTAQQDQIFASYIAFQLPVGITGILLAAIYAASQSTLSTGLNSVATSWTLDIQSKISSKELSFEKQTKIAQYVSLGVGIVSILVSMILANGEIKSAYEWFNSFMGLVLGVLAGIFVLGAFTKKATSLGAYVAFGVSALLVVFLKYNVPSVTSWAYAIISISTSVVVGYITSSIELAVTGKKADTLEAATVYCDRQTDEVLRGELEGV
ncbi:MULTISPECIES: sodium:solute symporter [unclassified Clostridium]|uniref:sodium:solute symporter n=1 Tax=unclassified Clostridium TaxID=2614128 RepID=UPI001C8CE779|nr:MULTISPECIES: sodium:solute symporter [unclassified Clostridium]MBX9137657.1 sodium:solute symporter [Clostridium sp. K12(2020)]MBX9144467.1 sodium:solute symporter [Clostridium sp. K13]